MSIADLSTIFWTFLGFFFPVMAFMWAVKIVFGWLLQKI